jgi:uracil-DNA glycosylase
MRNLPEPWEILSQEFEKPYFEFLEKFLYFERSHNEVYPPAYEVYKALELTDLDNVKCLILGQDPYHDKGQAHGLAFSVKEGVSIPPSLRNIYKELCSDIGIEAPSHGCLERWAENGVLLLNSILTVQAHKPASHRGIGWEEFTDSIIRRLSERDTPMAFILWGSFARSKKNLINTSKHLVVENVHPSPLSARNGFFGSKPFSKVNKFLKGKGIDPIDWRVD